MMKLISTIIILLIIIQHAIAKKFQVVQELELKNATVIYAEQSYYNDSFLLLLSNGSVFQISKSNLKTLSIQTLLENSQNNSTNFIMKPKKIKKKFYINALNSKITEYILANTTYLAYLIFENTTLILNKQIPFQSQILDIQFGQNSILLSHLNNYTTLIKNNRIFQRRQQNLSYGHIIYIKEKDQYIIGSYEGDTMYYNPSMPNQNSLIGYWNFEQIIDNKTLDASPFHNDALLNKVSIRKNLLKKGNDGLFLPYQINLQIPTFNNPKGSFTICFWFRTFNLTDINQTFFSKSNGSSGYYAMLNFLLEKKVAFVINGKNQIKYDINYPNFLENIQYFIAFVYNQINLTRKIYLNNTIFSFYNDKGTIIQSNSDFFIGTLIQKDANFSTVQSFNGTIDQFMIFDSPLEFSDLNQLYLRDLNKILNAKLYLSGRITQLSYQINLFILSNSTELMVGCQNGKIYQIIIKTIYITNATIASTNNIIIINSQNKSILNIRNYIQTSTNNLGKLKYTHLVSDETGKVYLINNQDSNIKTFQDASDGITDLIYVSDIFDHQFISVQINSSKIRQWKIKSNSGSSPVIPPATNQTSNNSNTSNTNNTSTPSLPTPDNTPISFPEQQIDVIICNSSSNKIKGECVLRSQIVQQVSSSISSVFSIPSIRIIAKAFYPAFIFLEDIWFYKYHLHNYSTYIQQIFQQTKRVNEQNIVPSFLSKQKIDNFKVSIQQISKQITISYEFRTPKKLKQVDIYNVGFLCQGLQILVWSILGSLIMTILLYALSIALKKSLQQFSQLKKITEFISVKGTFACFIAAVIQTNLISLSFYSFMQVKYSFYTNLQEKINIIISIICLFLILIYSTCFYLMIFKYSLKKVGQSLLNYTKWGFNSFFQALYLNSFRHFINGFIHGFLYQIYPLQICLLTLVNIIQLIVTIYYRKCFQYKISFIFLSCYYIFFALLDILFIIEFYSQNFAENQQKFVIYEIIITLTLFTTVIILILVQIIGPIYQYIKQKCKNNSVADEYPLQKKKSINEENKQQEIIYHNQEVSKQAQVINSFKKGNSMKSFKSFRSHQNRKTHRKGLIQKDLQDKQIKNNVKRQNIAKSLWNLQSNKKIIQEQAIINNAKTHSKIELTSKNAQDLFTTYEINNSLDHQNQSRGQLKNKIGYKTNVQFHQNKKKEDQKMLNVIKKNVQSSQKSKKNVKIITFNIQTKQ